MALFDSQDNVRSSGSFFRSLTNHGMIFNIEVLLLKKQPPMKSFATGIFVLSALLVTSSAFSQPGSQHNTFGVYIGPNYSNVDITSPQLSADSRAGFQTGMFYRSGKLLYGQAGLQYQAINSNFTMPDSNTTGEINDDILFRRLQLPLYGGLNLMPILKSAFNIRAYAGPVISYDFDIPDNSLSLTPSDFNRFRVDATFGAGMDVLIFSVDAGYTMGMNNLFHQDFEGKGNYAFVNVGLRF